MAARYPLETADKHVYRSGSKVFFF